MDTFKMVAKTLQGLEQVLAQELVDLGAADVQQGRRVVTFRGDLAMMYKANFCLRTALRVLKPINEFTARNADDVYQAVRQMNWEDYLAIDTSFAVDAVVYSEEFRHSKFVAYRVKDAIVDYFREKCGSRPNISVSNPDIRLNIHINDIDCTLSLDSSGESLHKRGYRVATVESPINEVLAAGMLLMTGWRGESDLVDPMCGSGTIAVEAALIARNVWPGVFHTEKYAFENWPDFNPDLLQEIYNDDSNERPFAHKIIARDIDPAAVNAATANVRSAGVSDCVELSKRPFEDFQRPEQPAIMVMNPPYGERITSPDLFGLYRTIGEKLKHQFVGNEAWIISYREEVFDKIGLKPSLKIPLFNGALECEYRKYQIFDGKFKEFRSEGGEIKTDDERRRMREKRELPRSFKGAGNFDSDRAGRREFTPRRGDEVENAPDIPEYLRLRHRSFLSMQRRREREAAESRPRRAGDRKFDKRFERGDRKYGPHDNKSANRRFDERGGKPRRHSSSPWAKKRED